MEQATLDRMKFDVWAAADDAERRICADAVPGADTLGIAVAREIGRMCGYYEPVKHVVEHNHSGELTLRQLSGMSDVELMKLMKADTPLLERVEDDVELALEMSLDEQPEDAE